MLDSFPTRALRPAASLTLSACLVLASIAAACGDDTSTGGSPAGGNPPEGGSGAGTNNGGAPSNGGGGNVSDGGGGGVTDGGNGGAPTGGAGCGLLPTDTAPELLSETGLYSDITDETIAPEIMAYSPQFALWSDAASKNRWAYIPDLACGQGPIDTSDMDFWEVPVGSRFWKEFTRDGVRIETRLIIRFGPDASDFEFATYHWDGSGDAVKIQNGLDDANGTGHDIPPITLCSSCHKSAWRVLGFSAVQLSHANGGATMASLSADGWLSDPLPGGVPVPGNPVEQAALGYLHANCGNCHFNGGVGNVPMHLKLLSTQTTVQTTDTFLTAVNMPTNNFQCNGSACDYIEPLSPSTSAVWYRINESSMPPFASEIPDATGAGIVAAWINQPP